MYQISSNITLFLRIFLPAFWLSFFGAVVAASFFELDQPRIGAIKMVNFRIGIVTFWCLGMAFFYFTFLKLRRVDIKDGYIYVSNFIRNVRYQLTSVEKITISDFTFFKLGRVHLVEKASFGKSIVFILNEKTLKKFIADFPQYTTLISEEA